MLPASVPAKRRVFEEFPIDFEALHGTPRHKLIDRFGGIGATNGVVFLEGGKTSYWHCTDKEILFRQEGYFHYLFGVEEADFMGAIDLHTGKSMLFAPRLPASYATWLGPIQPLSFFKDKYHVDQVFYADEASTELIKLGSETVFVLPTCKLEWLRGSTSLFKIDDERLQPEMDECRVIKTDAEIALLRHINEVSSYAHTQVMKNVHPGMREYDAEALFQYLTYINGRCRQQAYICICASGKNSATLHYPNNNKTILDNTMLLFDMGAEYHVYASDITCSFPANGRFTDDQRAIYETVLNAQQAVMNAMRPGVDWTDMHRLAEQVILEGLVKHGLVRGDIQDLKSHHIAALFFPHGLGHFYGIEVHDVGGYPKGISRIAEPGIENLRARRILQKDMCLTVEPGIYFIDALLDPALNDPIQSQFLVPEVISRFRKFGGVRIEDDVVVTENGIINLTKCPRTVSEIEKVMAEGRAEREQQQ